MVESIAKEDSCLNEMEFQYENLANTLDIRGFACPLPLLKTKLAMHALDRGELLKIITNDKNSLQDIFIYCRQIGHSVVMNREMNNDLHVCVLRK